LRMQAKPKQTRPEDSPPSPLSGPTGRLAIAVFPSRNDSCRPFSEVRKRPLLQKGRDRKMKFGCFAVGHPPRQRKPCPQLTRGAVRSYAAEAFAGRSNTAGK